ncbi:N-6 DNA methylase [Frigoribacterium sp. CG_9.8]|uniref:N-6 DNA methylase n=1 Tax=Frigoribacterium sp. CG_9.8 TaxID=2787733 RepID=UPI0018CA8E6C|nr:methylase of polypeptide subunit release factors [Frigoribacterium sp. CG_9.8]
MKKDLTVKNAVENAEPQLAGYLQNKMDTTGDVFAGIITDGVLWRLYALHRDGLAFVTEFKLARGDHDSVDRLQTWLDAILLTGPKLTATKPRIIERLGSGSPRFLFDRARLEKLYEENRHSPEVSLKKELWARLLRTALGTAFTDDEKLFLDHTMLVIEAEVIAHLVVGLEPASLSAKAVLAGDQFHTAGITNVVEADFFDWPAEVDGGPELVMDIVREISQFEWSHVQHDVLKALYEAVITPEVRKNLGEYYTEDWLAQRIVDLQVDDPLNQRVADVACGSGTFVFHAVRRYLEATAAAGIRNADAIDQLQDRVFGMDIHPVSVVLARVTYLLAIGADRLRDRRRLTVPIYLGDSIQWGRGSRAFDGDVISIPVDAEDLATVDTEAYEALFTDSQVLRIPVSAISDPATLDLLVSELATLAQTYTDTSEKYPLLSDTLTRYEVTDAADRTILTETFHTLCDLNAAGRDHIWGYFVRNQIRPIWLSRPDRQLDRLIGNPPWLSYRFMSESMQAQFKLMSESRNLWEGGKVATHQDLVGLFIARTVEQFLRPGGTFAFVTPFAVLSRMQYAGFRAGKWLHNGTDQVTAKFSESWDLSAIRPALFPVPSAVVFGVKTNNDATALPSSVLELAGRHDELFETRASIQQLTGEDTYLSPYATAPIQGATIVPRVLFMVNEEEAGPLGRPAGTTAVVSARSTLEKKPWSEVETFTTTIESEFVHPILLGSSIVPHRIAWPAQTVLPVRAGRLLNATEIRKHELLHQRWSLLGSMWSDRKKQGAISLLEQVDWQGKLHRQFPAPPIRVLYSSSGNRIAATICSDTSAIVDNTLYWLPVSSRAEGHFLCAILNSGVVAERIGKLQSRGLFGARHIHMIPWRLPIPRYDPDHETHALLASLGDEATKLAASVDLTATTRFTEGRAAVRKALSASGTALSIDEAVTTLFEVAVPVN